MSEWQNKKWLNDRMTDCKNDEIGAFHVIQLFKVQSFEIGDLLDFATIKEAVID